jgi:hypothetical protein
MVCGIPAPKIPHCGNCGYSENAKLRVFQAKMASFWAKKRQNRGFTVTDSSTGLKCKPMNPCKLQAVEGSKKASIGGGGVGVRRILGEEKENIKQRTGNRE